jgi:hypothetical protein
MMTKSKPKSYIFSFDFSIFTYLLINMATSFTWLSVCVNQPNLGNYMIALLLKKL